MMTHDSMQIVAYGPSLQDTWKDINPDEPLMTMSGSLKFLLSKGLKPRWGKWFHIHVDPRADNLECVVRNKDVCYILGTCTNPIMFKMLEGMKIVIFHPMSGPHTKTWIEQNDPGQIMTCGGSTVGLTSIHVAGVMGFYHFEIFGMDGGFMKGKRHADTHGGIRHGERDSVFHPGWMTSRLMDNANFETCTMLRSFPVCCVWHGEGLLQDWVSKSKIENVALHGTPKAEIVRKTYYKRATPEVAAQALAKARKAA
jgi:hypothetical protein